MEHEALFDLITPQLKSHPWILWVLAVAFVLAVVWSFTPNKAKVWVGKIPHGIGPRIVALFDLASAIAMFVLGKIFGVLWHGFIKGEIKPERIDRATPQRLVEAALKQITREELVAIATAARAPAVSDRYVCRQCGCYWRLNPPSAVQPDGSWSLYDPSQTSCARCDNSPDFLTVIRPAPTPVAVHGEGAR